MASGFRLMLTTCIRPLGSPPAPVPVALPTSPIPPSTMKTDETFIVTKASNAITPGRPAPKSPVMVPRTTAQDLLNNVIGPKRGVDVSRPPRTTTSSTLPQFPFGLGPNAPPSIWSTSLDQGSPPPFNSPSLGLRSEVNVGQTFPSPSLQYTWSPQFESTQTSRQLAPQLSPQFPSSQSLSAVSPGHRSISLSFGTPPHIPQPIFQTSHMLAPLSSLAEHRQSVWQNSNHVPLVDPAIVSAAATVGQSTTAQHGLQGISNGHTHHLVRPGPHQKSPSTSRIWGIHG